MAAAEVMVARNMARYEADRDAAAIAEEASSRASWDDALSEGQARWRQEDASAVIHRREAFAAHMDVHHWRSSDGAGTSGHDGGP
ncbi:hypothetical protein QYE76_015090 [Lolium multiflorum]|uniref:Uncharacterized protein n=1 Tax=Lolium multiflorum TaxID=4521 RepID=A0AAD8U5S4_LOLMU|nr:hypothetical protein QYE76_015090 [Lolium multiflorum]